MTHPRPLMSTRALAPLVVAALLTAALSRTTANRAPAGVQAAVSPAGRWPTATPESQGLSSDVLTEMLAYVRERRLPVHGILIVRHGRAVLDATFHPYQTGQLHDIASATKTVTSILVGIALDKGYLKSVEQPVAELLPGAMPAAGDPRKRGLTVEHLLTMTSGLHCGVEPGEKELAAMRRSADWPAFALALPLWAEPGSRYAYCSCNNHLLSAILSARTGDSALAFARKHLFGPLGIEEAIWPADPRGRTHGWGDLRLHPHDLAKLGWLYLRGGRWNGAQVVSEAWVGRSIAPRVTVREGVGYGYSWWINTARQPAIYEMVGRGGQRVAVLPDEDLVITFNGGGVNTDDLAPFLFKALRSKSPLPESPDGLERLRKGLDAARQPPPPSSTSSAAAPLPALAREISGKSYAIETNPLNLQRLSLTFSGPAEARAAVRLANEDFTAPVGLDGRARLSSTGPSGLPMALRGEWLSPREFLLDLDTVGNINHFTIRMRFAGETVNLRIDETTGELTDLRVPGRALPAR